MTGGGTGGGNAAMTNGGVNGGGAAITGGGAETGIRDTVDGTGRGADGERTASGSLIGSGGVRGATPIMV